MSVDHVILAKSFETLPLATYRSHETVLRAGSKTGRLLILKSGEVEVSKDSTVIAKVETPGAVFGEISALLDMPHLADVKALRDSEFYVADASVIEKDAAALLHVARILARRLDAANQGVIELRHQLPKDNPPGPVNKIIRRIEEILRVGGVSYEAGV